MRRNSVLHLFTQYFLLAFPWIIVLSLCLSGQTSRESYPTFDEQFIYSIITLESGTAYFIGDDGKKSGAISPGTLLKTESTIEIGGESLAEIRLACGSFLRLTPGSRLKIRPFGLDLVSGSVLARHVGIFFPMKIEGAATLLVSKDSLVDVERQGEKVLARVQVGEMKTPGIPDAILAGQSIEASGRTANITPFGPSPMSWNNPILRQPEGYRVNLESVSVIDQEIAESEAVERTTEKPGNGQPLSEPQTPVLGEDWMKEPIPINDNAE